MTSVVVTQTTINASVVQESVSVSVTSSPINVTISPVDINSHSAVTIGTANGLSLSGQVLSLGLSSSLATGALSSADWSTFNNKQNALGYTPVNIASAEWVDLTDGGATILHSHAGGGGDLPAADTQTIIKGSSDPTKLLRFEVDGFTAGATRVLTPPNANVLLAGQDFLNVFTVNQQMDAHLAVGADADVNNPGVLLYPAFVTKAVFSSQEETTLSQTGVDYSVGVLNQLLINPSDAGGTSYIGADIEVASKSGNVRDMQAIVGVYGAVLHLGDGNLSALTGLEYYAENDGGGDIEFIYGGAFSAWHYGSGLVTELIGVYADCDVGGPTTTAYGIYVKPIAGAGTNYAIITTGAGLVEFNDQLFVDGSADRIQLRVQAHSTQTSNLQTWENSGDAVVASMSGTGVLTIAQAPVIGGFTLTVPATLTVAGLAIANIYTAAQSIAINDAVTNTTTTLVTLAHNSTGTPAVSFGTRLLFNLESDTTADQNAGAIDVQWTTATHATMKSKMVLNIAANGVLNPVLALQASGLTLNVPAAGNGDVLLQVSDAGVAYFRVTKNSTNGHMTVLQTASSDKPGLVISGGSSATGTLQEWRFTGGTVLASISSVGFTLHNPITTTTNAVFEVMRLQANVSTAATGGANGFGVGQSFYAETATDGTNQQQGLISTSWIDATNASRKAKMSLSAYDTAARLGIEIEASGSVVMLGFYGATAVIRATTAGAASTFVANTSAIANDTATFDGFTIGQVVKALRNIGILT